MSTAIRDGAELRMVGLDRGFPEDPNQFFNYMLRQVADSLIGKPMTPETQNVAKTVAFQALSNANRIYDLGVDISFWRVETEENPEMNSLMLNVVPASFPAGNRHRMEIHEEGGFIATLGGHFVRGPDEMTTLVGLGRLVEKRNTRP